MEIQRCANCGTKFNYMDLQKTLWLGYFKHIKCRNCGEESAMKFRYRFIFSILIFLPVFFAYPINNLATTMTSVILAYVVYIAVISALSPFVFKYNIEKNKN